MGLAASQARLLSLTARLSNSEFEIQSNLNQKNRLSGTSDGITREYENSLNLKKMTMQVYDKDGASQVDLSYRALTKYVKDSLDNPPYIVVDGKNRAVITADILDAYQDYIRRLGNVNGKEQARLDWEKAKGETETAKIQEQIDINDMENKKAIFIRDKEALKTEFLEFKPVADRFNQLKDTIKVKYEKFINTPPKQTPGGAVYIKGKNAQRGHGPTDLDMDNYAASVFSKLAALYKDAPKPTTNLNDDLFLDYDSSLYDQTSKDTFFDTINVDTYQYNLIGPDGTKIAIQAPPEVSKGCSAQTSHMHPYSIGIFRLWYENFDELGAVYKNNEGKSEAEMNKAMYDELQIILKGKPVIDDTLKNEWEALLNEAYGTDMLNKADWEAKNPFGQYGDVNFDKDTDANNTGAKNDGRGDGTDGYEATYMKNLREWQAAAKKVYGDDMLNWADFDNDYLTNPDDLNYDLDKDAKSRGNLADKNRPDTWSSEDAYVYAMEKILNTDYEELIKNKEAEEERLKNIYDNYKTDTDNNLWKKYDPKLFEKMTQDGYNLELQHDLDDIKWFQAQLRAGNLFIQRYDNQSLEGKGGYVDDSWQSGTVPVSEVQDYEGRAAIKIKYDNDMARLQKIDKNFDLNIKRLESEHQALEVEYDAVKKVIEKNVDSSFKTFG